MISNNELGKYKKELIEICNQHDELQHFITEIKIIPVPYPSILFVGKFGVGKTRIINALLGQDILPISIMPMRRFYLRIGHSSNGKYALILYKHKKEEQLLSKESLEKTITNDEDNSILGVEVFGSFELLKSGIDILESPGFGEINPEHEKITNLLLAQTQILALILDINSELIPMEYEFIKNIPSHIKHVLVILNDNSPVTEAIITSETISTMIWNVEKTISFVPHTFVSTFENYPSEYKEQISNQPLWGIKNISKKIETLFTTPNLDRAEYFEKFTIIGNQMLTVVENLRSTHGKNDLNNSFQPDYVDKASQLLDIISDQQKDLFNTLLESYSAEIFKFLKTIPSDSPIEVFIHNRLENTELKLNEHLLYWAANQESLLEDQLQRLYDKVSRELVKITNIDNANNKVYLVEIVTLISHLKTRTKEKQFKDDLLHGLLEIIDNKTGFLLDLVKNNLVRSNTKEELTLDDDLMVLIKIETKIEELLYRIKPTRLKQTRRDN